ncbi:MAG: radical SAM protein [Candidatus Aminicenantes bacterium]|jgi:organic radical activating enzyme
MTKTLKVKVAGLCAEIRAENNPTRTYLQSKFRDFLSRQKRTDLIIEIEENEASLSRQSMPSLSFAQGKFHILPDKNPTVNLGIIDLGERRCTICDFANKSKLIHSVLLCLALFLEKSGGIILHASAAYKNHDGYLFPGPANAGKSTMLKQMKNYSPFAEEWVAVKKTGNDFFMWSIPHPNAQNKKKKIKKIIFPKKGKAIKSKRLKSQVAAKKLLANCLFSTMHPETVGGVLERVTELAQKVSCCELEFPLHVWLDKEIEQKELLEKKKKTPPRMNWPEGSDLSALHESLILTWECNLHCLHCRPYLPPNGTLSLNDVKEHLDSLAKKGTLFLHLTGGEPLIHKDFWKIVSYANQKNFALILHTNGTLITPEFGERLKNFNFLQVSLTVLGGNAQTHDSLTGVKGSFEKTVHALKIMKEKGLDVVLSTTKLSDNQDEIPEMERLANNHGATLKIIPYQTPHKGEFEEFNRCYQKNFQRS